MGRCDKGWAGWAGRWPPSASRRLLGSAGDGFWAAPLSNSRACHTPCRALTRLTKLLRGSGEPGAGAGAPPLGVGALVGVVQPLLLQMIVEGKAGASGGEGGGGHELKQAEVDRGANVTDAAVVALGAVAGALPWVQYQQLLGQHLRLMKRHAGGCPADAASPAARRHFSIGAGGDVWESVAGLLML